MFDILQVDPDRATGDVLHEHLGHAQLADELGLDYIFFAERHFMPLYRAATPNLLLATLSTTTRHARLGVMAWTVALHNPILLAEQISALDHLTAGRLDVGVGLGHRPQEIASLGLPPEHRHAIFLESVILMQQAWQGKPVSHDGALYHVRDVLVDPPLQRPHPPLWYAGNDPEAAGWAARNRFNLAIGFQPDLALTKPARAFRNSQQADEPRHLAIMRHIYVAESDAEAREDIINDLMRLGTELVANPRGVPNAPTTPPSRAEAERQYADQQKRQIVVSGSPERVARQIAETMQTLDADVYLANVHLMGVEDARVRRTLRLYAQEVVPRVREMVAGGS